MEKNLVVGEVVYDREMVSVAYSVLLLCGLRVIPWQHGLLLCSRHYNNAAEGGLTEKEGGVRSEKWMHVNNLI